MPKYPVPKEEFRIISVEEIKKYVDAAPDNDSKFCFALAWLTGMRISEILGLTIRNITINETEKYVTVKFQAKKHGKIGRPTFDFSDPFISDYIIPYIQEAIITGRERILIRSTTRRYQQILKEVNKKLYGDDKIKYLCFHMFRHSRISWLLEHGATTPAVMGWIGKATSPDDYIILNYTKEFRGKLGL